MNKWTKTQKNHPKKKKCSHLPRLRKPEGSTNENEKRGQGKGGRGGEELTSLQGIPLKDKEQGRVDSGGLPGRRAARSGKKTTEDVIKDRGLQMSEVS